MLELTLMIEELPTKQHEYECDLWTTRRWLGFESRGDDILVCTSYKAGTTWTQNICALLIHQSPELDQPLAELSPWMEVLTGPVEAVHENYAAQQHRRFIKTHTPLDGLVYDPQVQYVYCGRDPRDVFMSMLNHIENMDMEVIAKLREEQDLAPLADMGDMPEDPNVIFQAWLTTSLFEWEDDGFPFWSHFNHARSFWDFQHLPNLHFLHYQDLKDDLSGQMKRLAGFLDIEIDEAAWPELVDAATFDSMKNKASQMAPESTVGLWKDDSQFFNKGTSGQWQGVLSDESMALYGRVRTQKMSPDLADWLEKGSLICGYPR
jgi:aryl sulfotransferase